MLEVKRVQNTIFNSNTFILTSPQSSVAYLVDCGDVDKIMAIIGHKEIKGVFITHSHFDHIYGLNNLIEFFPKCILYISSEGSVALRNPKLNFSRYHDCDFVYQGESSNIVHNGDRISLFDSQIEVECVATPGHDAGCMTYVIRDYIFTGDSYIPGLRTVTNLRGNKAEAKESEERIKAVVESRGLIICPGHGDVANGLLTSL